MNDTFRFLGNFLRNRWRNVIDFFHLQYQAAFEFSNDNALKFSASLSYYTLFSLAPMLIIVIAISSIWFGKEAAEGFLYQQFEGLFLRYYRMLSLNGAMKGLGHCLLHSCFYWANG